MAKGDNFKLDFEIEDINVAENVEAFVDEVKKLADALGLGIEGLKKIRLDDIKKTEQRVGNDLNGLVDVVLSFRGSIKKATGDLDTALRKGLIEAIQKAASSLLPSAKSIFQVGASGKRIAIDRPAPAPKPAAPAAPKDEGFAMLRASRGKARQSYLDPKIELPVVEPPAPKPKPKTSLPVVEPPAPKPKLKISLPTVEPDKGDEFFAGLMLAHQEGEKQRLSGSDDTVTKSLELVDELSKLDDALSDLTEVGQEITKTIEQTVQEQEKPPSQSGNRPELDFEKFSLSFTDSLKKKFSDADGFLDVDKLKASISSGIRKAIDQGFDAYLSNPEIKGGKPFKINDDLVNEKGEKSGLLALFQNLPGNAPSKISFKKRAEAAQASEFPIRMFEESGAPPASGSVPYSQREKDTDSDIKDYAKSVNDMIANSVQAIMKERGLDGKGNWNSWGSGGGMTGSKDDSYNGDVGLGSLNSDLKLVEDRLNFVSGAFKKLSDSLGSLGKFILSDLSKGFGGSGAGTGGPAGGGGASAGGGDVSNVRIVSPIPIPVYLVNPPGAKTEANQGGSAGGGSVILGTFTTAISVFLGSIKGILEGAGAAAASVLGVAAITARFVQSINPGLVEIFNLTMQDLTAVVGTALQPVLEGLIPVIRLLADLLLPIAQMLAERFRQLMDGLAPVIKILFGVAATLIRALMPVVDVLIAILVPALQMVGVLLQGLGAILNGLISFIGSLFGNNVVKNISNAGEFLVNAFKKLVSQVVLLIAAVAQAFGMRSFVKGMKDSYAMQDAIAKDDNKTDEEKAKEIQQQKTLESKLSTMGPQKLQEGLQGVGDLLMKNFGPVMDLIPKAVKPALAAGGKAMAEGIVKGKMKGIDAKDVPGDLKKDTTGLAAAQNAQFKSADQMFKDMALKAAISTSAVQEKKKGQDEYAAEMVQKLGEISDNNVSLYDLMKVLPGKIAEALAYILREGSVAASNMSKGVLNGMSEPAAFGLNLGYGMIRG